MDGVTRRGRAVAAAVLGMLIGAAAVLPPLRPLPIDLCLLHRMTGIPCLTCGLTRAICLCVQGRWTEGMAMHPAAPIAVAILIGGALWFCLEAVRGRFLGECLRRRLSAALIGSGAVVSALAWVERIGEIVYQR